MKNLPNFNGRPDAHPRVGEGHGHRVETSGQMSVQTRVEQSVDAFECQSTCHSSAPKVCTVGLHATSARNVCTVVQPVDKHQPELDTPHANERTQQAAGKGPTRHRNCHVRVNVSIQRARLRRRSPRFASRSFINGYIIRRAQARNQRTRRTKFSDEKCRVFVIACAIPSTWNQLVTYRKASRRIVLSARNGS
jgi:hypothetical protein